MMVFRFREDCLSAGKSLLVWTVNDPAYMMEVRKKYHAIFKPKP